MNVGSEMISVRKTVRILPAPSRSSASLRSAEASLEAHDLSGTTDWLIDEASFERLLHWLDPDLEMAAQQYEIIRRKLIMFYSSRRCFFAEDLADETFNRVARRLSQIKEHYIGNPQNYFFGVARKIYLEYLRSSSVQKSLSFLELPSLPSANHEAEELFAHLDECLDQLPPKDRELILTYYQRNGRDKIDNRKMLADELGISISALRIRVHRIVSHLRKQAYGRLDGSLMMAMSQ
ncbi:MAG TPA: sigma-70 family RNA polymerase sigma factor [Blastocatellia bacterium]|nr:sigma-70 family RNA polymerase sigma factor [Blastocatellia bacterium]